VSSKHQVTLPIAALTEAGISAGDELRVEVDRRGSIRLTAETDRVEAVRGAFPGLSAATDLERLRDEWER